MLMHKNNIKGGRKTKINIAIFRDKRQNITLIQTLAISLKSVRHWSWNTL